MTPQPTTCTFQHAGFRVLGRSIFRLTEGDRIPALVVELDGAEAVVPLQSVPRLFDLPPDGPDVRMLNLVGSALRFVVCLGIGDPLPTEILTGKASWTPSDHHRQIASARLTLQLLDWITHQQDTPAPSATPAPVITAAMLVADDPHTRPIVQDALHHAARTLDLKGGGIAVAALIADLAEEIAYIEALRERLLDRVQSLLRRLNTLGTNRNPFSVARRETLVQVTRLAATGLAQIVALFVQVDEQTSDILLALRNLDQQRSFLRPNRDWLYCTQIAWDAELKEWEAVPSFERGEQLWKLVDRLYRFLAPRFMVAQEWQKLDRQVTALQARAAVVW